MNNERYSKEGPLHPSKKPKVAPPPKPKGDEAPPVPKWSGKKTWAITTAGVKVKVIDPQELYRRIDMAWTDAFTGYMDDLGVFEGESETETDLMQKSKLYCIEPELDSEIEVGEDPETETESKPIVKDGSYFRKRIMARNANRDGDMNNGKNSSR